MGELYEGHLDPAAAGAAYRELQEAKLELARYSPSEVIWDTEHLDSEPPWGNDISSDITNLANYFVTSDGRDLFEVMEEAFRTMMESAQSLRVA